MYYLSKGYVTNNPTNNIIEVAHFLSKKELYGAQRETWLAGLEGFQKVSPENSEVINELLEDGLVVLTEDDSDEAKYHLLCRVIFLPCRPKKRVHLLFGEENVIYKWLRFAGVTLITPEIIFLIDNQIEPTPDLLHERNTIKLVSRIYLERPDLDKNLEFEMMKAESCRRVCDDLLRMLRKRRLYIE